MPELIHFLCLFFHLHILDAPLLSQHLLSLTLHLLDAFSVAKSNSVNALYTIPSASCQNMGVNVYVYIYIYIFVSG